MSDKSQKNKTDDGLRRFLRHTLAPLGGAAGSTLGLALGVFGIPGGEAIGAVAGSAAGNLLTGLGQEIWDRHLSHREKQRLGTVLGVMVTEIHRRLENGETLRGDGFFEKKQGDRSDAEEVAESVLLKVQREPEEKKIPYMGCLFVSTAFNPAISAQMAHQLTKIAEQLTYRQLCILKLSVVKDTYNLRDRNYREQGKFSKDLYQVLYECTELHIREYISIKDAGLSGVTNVKPRGLTLQGIGGDLYNLMKLFTIPDADIIPIAEQLK